MKKGHIILIDSSGFAYRAYHTGANQFRADGLPTWAITGFMELLWNLLGAAEADKPTHGSAVFDAGGKTFRHKLYAQYKNNRPARDEELSAQLPYMRHVADTLGLTSLELKNHEADDVLATLATRAKKLGMRTSLISSDKDLLQMVEDDVIEIIDPVGKKRYREADVIEKFGVPPSQVAEVQALAGDAVDNIIGIPGIGLERAAALIRRFGSLEEVLKNADKARWPQARVNLKRHADKARLNLKLTTLKRNVPIKVDFDDLVTRPVMRAHLEELGRALGAPNRVAAIFSTERKTHRTVEAVEDPFSWWREELLAPGQRLPDAPQSGYYQRRLQKGGVFVPARIWREPETDFMGKATGKEVLRCEVGGQMRDANSEWGRLAMHPISEETYRYEKADADHAKKYRPGDPKATPHVRPDIMKMSARHNPRGR